MGTEVMSAWRVLSPVQSAVRLRRLTKRDFLWASSALGIESQPRGRPPIPSGFHRASRYPFAANVELTDVRSDGCLTARTTTLSLFGCYVITGSPFPEGTKVSLRITHGGTTLAAFGKVVYSKPNSGMGIAFTEVEPSGQAILEKWIVGLRTE